MRTALTRLPLSLRCLLGAALILAVDGAAARADCPSPVKPKVTVTLTHDPPREDRSLPVGTLTQMRVGPRPAAYPHSLGLTESRVTADVALSTQGMLKSAGYCAAIGAAEVTLHLSSVVHIASGIAPDSCIDREVRRHEQMHLDLALTLLDTASTQVRDALAGVAAEPIGTGGLGDADRALQARAEAAIDRAMLDFAATARERQAGLDTEEEYARVSQVCGAAAFEQVFQGE